MNRVFLFFLFVQLFIHAQLDAQKIYYVRQEANFDGTIVGCFDIATCSDSTICRVKEFWAFDIAVCPNGSIYIDGWGVDNEQLLTLPGVALLNVPDSSYSIVMPFNNGHNSCTCSAEGVIYSSGYDVWSYNTNTGVADSLGSFELNTQLAGDLSFYNGQLIGIDPNKNILAIDLNDPSMSPVLYTYSTTLPIPAIGMVTLAQNCDSAVVYLSFSDEDGGVTQHDPINQLYKLNLPDSTITFVCTMPRGVGGLASLEEGIASDCSVRLDLDNNDSSGAPDSDYRYDAWCGNSGVAICDVDAEVYSGYRIDSLRLRMLSPVPDGGSEFLSVGFLPDPVGVSGQNSQWLSLVRTSVPISDEVVAAGAFEEALKSILLYNMNPVPTAGSRQIEVILFAQGNRSDTALVTITIPNMEVTITGDAQLCFGETTILAVDGAYQAYHWSTGDDDPGIEVISSGIYTVTVTASNGCTAVANWSVDVLDAIEAVWEAQSPSCYNYQDGMIELGAVSGGISPYTYRINIGAWTTSEVFPNLPAGTWYLGVEDSNGCRGQDTLTLLNPLPVLVDLGNDLTIEAGETTTLSPSVSPTGLFIYTWTPSSGLSCTQCLQPETTVFSDTRYTFQVVNEQGCTASDSIMIRVLLPDGSIYVPTIFAPDGEKSANNYFTVYGDPLFTGKIEYLRVYDRWGSLVYEGKGLPVDGNSTGWDGNSRGRPAPSGVYIWEAKIQFLNGNVVVKKGDITLLR